MQSIALEIVGFIPMSRYSAFSQTASQRQTLTEA